MWLITKSYLPFVFQVLFWFVSLDKPSLFGGLLMFTCLRQIQWCACPTNLTLVDDLSHHEFWVFFWCWSTLWKSTVTYSIVTYVFWLTLSSVSFISPDFLEYTSHTDVEHYPDLRTLVRGQATLCSCSKHGVLPVWFTLAQPLRVSWYISTGFGSRAFCWMAWRLNRSPEN